MHNISWRLKHVVRTSSLGAIALLFVLLSWVGVGAENITLTWLVPTPDKLRTDLMKEVIAGFQAEHPGVKVELLATASLDEAGEKLRVMTAGGTAPDVAQVSGGMVPRWYKDGLALDLTPFMERDKYDVTNLPQNYESFTYKGHWYGVPFDGGSFVGHAMFYNNDLFQQAGLRPPQFQPDKPTANWTWDEFKNAALKLTVDKDGDGVPNQFGANFTWDRWPTWVWSNGGDILNSEGTKALVDRPEFYDGIQWWADLNNRQIQPLKNANNEFQAGNVGMVSRVMMWVGTWSVDTTLPFDWGLTIWPRGKAGSIAQRGSNPLAISNTTKHPEMAWEFLKYWLSDKVQYRMVVDTHSIPPQTYTIAKNRKFWSVPTAPHDLRAFILAETKALPTYIDDWTEINEVLRKQVTAVWQNQKSARTAMNEAAEVINAVLARVQSQSR